jgi:hypothetical protein
MPGQHDSRARCSVEPSEVNAEQIDQCLGRDGGDFHVCGHFNRIGLRGGGALALVHVLDEHALCLAGIGQATLLGVGDGLLDGIGVAVPKLCG